MNCLVNHFFLDSASDSHYLNSIHSKMAIFLKKIGLGSNIGHGLFVGWVEYSDIFCWVSFLNPTYKPAIFVLSAKPNKISENRTIPKKYIKRGH